MTKNRLKAKRYLMGKYSVRLIHSVRTFPDVSYVTNNKHPGVPLKLLISTQCKLYYIKFHVVYSHIMLSRSSILSLFTLIPKALCLLELKALNLLVSATLPFSTARAPRKLWFGPNKHMR